ncbi:hypothetical protein ACIRPX_21560 [Streptomyces sp. NPDC101225]|uniref:hypothetical protein n=1 Tax=Streptomyces sp. NPDC101225 TaxID=3366135 RepID=UPI00380909F4
MADIPPSHRSARAAARRWMPPPALCGFLLLLALVFSVSYAVGSAVGPVAPGLHSTGTTEGGGGSDGNGGGMDDMPGMGHGSGE